MNKETDNNVFKKQNKLRFVYILLLSCSGALVLGFIIRAIADYATYNPLSTSMPFGFVIILRAFEFLVPAVACLVAGLVVRKKSGDSDIARQRRIEKKQNRTPADKKKLKKRLIIIAASFLVFVILSLTVAPVIGLSVFINRHIGYGETRDVYHPLQGTFSAKDFGLSENLLSLKSADGEDLWCSEIAPEKPDATVIFLTGIEQPSVTFFYPHAKMMLEENVASFLLEVRSHGESSGKQLGLGYTEIDDVRAVMDYIAENGRYNGVPVIVWGVSMGGAVALNSFGEIDEIDACIAMSPYASFEDELDLGMKERHVPAGLRSMELFFLKIALELNFGRDVVDSLTPENSIKKANGRPVALIACSDDSSVPAENTEILKEANPDAMVWIRDSWEHFIIKDCDFLKVEDDSEYCDFTKDFIFNVIADNK